MHRHTGFKAEHLQSGGTDMDGYGCCVLIEERWWYGLWPDGQLMILMRRCSRLPRRIIIMLPCSKSCIVMGLSAVWMRSLLRYIPPCCVVRLASPIDETNDDSSASCSKLKVLFSI